MKTLISLTIQLLPKGRNVISSGSVGVVVNLSKLVIFDYLLENGVFIAPAAAIGNTGLDTIYYYKWC